MLNYLSQLLCQDFFFSQTNDRSARVFASVDPQKAEKKDCDYDRHEEERPIFI